MPNNVISNRLDAIRYGHCKLYGSVDLLTGWVGRTTQGVCRSAVGGIWRDPGSIPAGGNDDGVVCATSQPNCTTKPV